MRAWILLPAVLFFISACGHDGESAPSGGDVAPDTTNEIVITPPSVIPGDPDAGLTTVRYTNFFNQNTICTKLSTWDQNSFIYIFPKSVSLANDLTFKRGKVYQTVHGVTAVASDLIGNLNLGLHNNAPGCTLVISGGNLTAVNP